MAQCLVIEFHATFLHLNFSPIWLFLIHLWYCKGHQVLHMSSNFRYTYQVGQRIFNGSLVWGHQYSFKAPPYPGEDSLQRVVIFGDMGKVQIRCQNLQDACPFVILCRHAIELLYQCLLHSYWQKANLASLDLQHLFFPYLGTYPPKCCMFIANFVGAGNISHFSHLKSN